MQELGHRGAETGNLERRNSVSARRIQQTGLRREIHTCIIGSLVYDRRNQTGVYETH